jgi:hypothetical protein
MVVSDLLSGTAGCYLTLTLSSAALAKLRTWRGSALSVARERVFPARAAVAVVVAVSAVELALATAIVAGANPVMAGLATAGVFTCFCAYRLAVAVRIKSLRCACAGPATHGPATLAAVSAVIVTSAFQAAAGCAWALADHRPEAWPVTAACAVGWAAPLVVLLAGTVARRRASSAPNPGEADVSPPFDQQPAYF